MSNQRRMQIHLIQYSAVRYAVFVAALLFLPASRAEAAGGKLHSQITAITVAGSQPAGTFGAISYKRTWGTVSGIVTPDENVHGFAALPHDADGNFIYQSQFEIIAPEKPGTNSVIVIEAENRGNAVFLNTVNDVSMGGPPSETSYAGPGNGFLFKHGTSYARVQWQPGIAAGVPKQAEGIGEVIVRDFARLLAGRTQMESKSPTDFGTYHTLILGGISISGFFINTFIAEGFNADPADGRAVFDGAIAVDGTGNWLAINQLAAAGGIEEFPYLMPDGKPLAASAILSRPASDPYYIDIANYTDFYRLRASLTDAIPTNARMLRYDWPSPHAAVPMDQSAIRSRASKCNGGVLVDLNPISYAPYLRAVMLELKKELGVNSAKNAPPLPPSTLFKLGPAPSITANFNPLPGTVLAVPLTDEDAQPVGGVRFPETDHPIGRPTPVSLPPVVTSSIEGTCGNLGEWQKLSAAKLAKRYGDLSNYLKLYAQSVDKLVAEGYLLSSERAAMLETAKALFNRPAAN